MLIVADENMPHVETFFSRLGEVRRVPGRSLTADAVRDADLLLVRSVTRVDRALLTGSRVRFVGSATIGTDHVDQPWLAERGIAFSAAPGCNAESVAQYMAAALAWCAGRTGLPLSQSSIGIVGVGNCGSRVERVARALGLDVVLNDPPLARRSGDPKYRPLDELIDCDYLALHVPLTRDGPDPTWGLIGEKLLDRMKRGAIVINACRGHVLDEAALLTLIERGWLGGAVLDAWEHEPTIARATAERVLLGTPHIAGYSHDGKVNGTRMVYEAACRHLGRDAEPVDVALPEPAVARIVVNAAGRAFDAVLAELALTAYPIHRDDVDLRTVLRAAGDEAIGTAFDGLRKRYPTRREFAATRVELRDALPDRPPDWPTDWAERIRAVGFDVAS